MAALDAKLEGGKEISQVPRARRTQCSHRHQSVFLVLNDSLKQSELSSSFDIPSGSN